MKMGNRRLKRLDALGVKSQNKPALTMEPMNRAEQRKLKRTMRRAGITDAELTQARNEIAEKFGKS